MERQKELLHGNVTANTSDVGGFSVMQKVLYVILGALLTGAMWRLRGTHGWGSSWGVLTVGFMLLLYIYFVFRRKSNASFFHITASALLCMLTTPAWGTLLNQISGYFSSHATEETYPCTPVSGVFIMMCLGFGTMPLYAFGVSRLFSDKRYSLWKYLAVGAVFFAVFLICCAGPSHWVLKLIQPQSVEAFTKGLTEVGKDNTAFEFYMKHFASIDSAKKIPFGRNYFTEISVISRAIGSIVTAFFVRFVFKDKAGGRLIVGICSAFAIGITVANVFFVLNNKIGAEAVPFLSYAWSLWEYFTGFIAGGITLAILFIADKKHPEANIRDGIIPTLPERVKDIVKCAVVMGVGFGIITIRPVAVRLDESKILPIVVIAAGGIAVIALCVMMFTGRLKKLWNEDAVRLSDKLVPVLFGLQTAFYLFVGYGNECKPKILVNNIVQYLVYATIILFYLIFLLIRKRYKQENTVK